MRKEFIEAAEHLNIWIFLGCLVTAVLCMVPEAVMESSEFNSWLSTQASFSLIVICIMWLATQSLWLFARMYLEKFGNWSAEAA